MFGAIGTKVCDCDDDDDDYDDARSLRVACARLLRVTIYAHGVNENYEEGGATDSNCQCYL